MSPSAHRTRRHALALLTVGLLSLSTACGSQVSRERILAGNTFAGGTQQTTQDGSAAGDAPLQEQVPGGAAVDGAPAAPGAPVPGEPVTGSAAGPVDPGDQGDADAPAAPGDPGPAAAAPRAGGAPAPAGARPAPASGSRGAASAAPGAPAAAAAASCAKSLKPIVLGQTLASSGLVGASISGLRNGLSIWAGEVNARGGVECHPVRLVQLDDGSDASRVSSNCRELIDERKAVALVGVGVPLAIAALRSCAEQKKVPVVGGDVTAFDWGRSPFLFPQGGSPITTNEGAVITAKQVKGGKKAGILYCVEAAICSDIKNNFPNAVKKAGVAAGPVKAVSLSQSDFTAECQQQKDAGTDIFELALDGSAAARVARNCASLGYRPAFALNAIAISATAANDSNLRAGNLFLGTQIVPFTEDGVPGARAFQDAFERYGSGAGADQPTMLGYSSGKLFEAALAKVSAKARAGDVTTAMVLEGLWQIKGETLGGLSPGATFRKGLPASVLSCYYGIRIDGRGVSAPDGVKKKCV